MPCYDSRSHDNPVLQAEMNRLTRMLCYATRKLHEARPEDIYSNQELWEWFEQHKEEDERRIKNEDQRG